MVDAKKSITGENLGLSLFQSVQQRLQLRIEGIFFLNGPTSVLGEPKALFVPLKKSLDVFPTLNLMSSVWPLFDQVLYNVCRDS